MKNRLRFYRIKTRLTVWFLVVALLPLLIVGAVIYNQRVQSIKTEAFDNLKTIRDLKVEQVNAWLDERIGDVRFFSRIAEIQYFEEGLSGKAGTRNHAKIIGFLSAGLNALHKHYRDYAEIFIIDAQSGKIVVSTDKSLEGKDAPGGKYLTEPLRTGEVYISDIFESRTLNKPAMVFSIPVHMGSGNRQSPSGVLVARIDLEGSIYQLLLDRAGLGKTGETLIVNQDVMALNELRWYSRAPLKLKIEAEPALLASQGKTGIVETADYRGEKVLAAYTYIPRTRWGFVAKMDQKEVYAPIQEMLISILFLFAVAAAGAGLISLFLARSLAQPIQAMTEVAKRIRGGDLSARNRISSEDEVGFLAESFNQAADSLAFRIETEKKSADMAGTLIPPQELKEFAGAVLGKLMDITESQLGSFYLRRTDDGRFEPLAGIGVNHELMGTFDAAIFEGEFGKALTTGEISRISRISEETVFKFKTFAGTAIPREMIAIPVVVKKEVRAMISLASLGGYSKAAMSILDQPTMVALNAAFANLLANEETRRLSEELRENNQKLQAQNEEVEAQAEEILKQTEELLERNTELERQRAAVEEANRLKSQFLSNMSHELRTPLNSVMALARVLTMQAGVKLSAEEVNYLEIIERNGKNLLTLINDLLDLSKIEAGRMDINPKAFSLRLTLENLVESIGPIAREKHIEIHPDIPEDLPPLKSDEIRVSQVLQNLIGNAVKFTHAGSVTVSARSGQQKVFVRVTDTGIGIAENDLPYIFDEFRQVDGTSARRHEGTGLGLAIARKAARMLGGDIQVTSALGTGSTFTLTLPVVWPGPAPAYEPIAIRRPSRVKSTRKTILVVDDEPEMAAMISRYLLQEGYNTVTATSGTEALKLAAREQPFAITLDIIMPDMDGWEVLQTLKKDPETKDIPVIIVSVSEGRETGFALGAVGHVTKPVSKERLISEIQRIGKPGTHSIMIVDDNDLDRREIRRVVEEEGFSTIVAEDGAACLELINKQVPHVLVLDLMMPEPDGFAVLERIRGNPETRDLPVIIVTAKDLTEEERKRLSGKVFSVLEKSAAKSATLLKEIKRILGDLENLPQPPGLRQSTTRPRILLVEDNEAAIIQVKAILESSGYIADVARGGQEAFDYLSHTIPDGIILDLMLPEIDGFLVLERIRRMERTAKIPVLILTARDLTPEDFKRLSANHIQQLVQKGDVDRDSLLFKIKSMLGTASGPRAPVRLETGNLEPETQEPKRETGSLKPENRKPEPGQPVTILAVEDNPDHMTTIKAVLQNRYRVLEAKDGEEGLRMAAESQPDLILLDMALPKMDGFALLRHLKENRELSRIPVIAMTARVMKGDREKILDAGGDDYISKPIDPESFLKMVGEWLKR